MLSTELGYFGNVTFCDDIRQEANGKFLLIGVYQSEIVFQSLPVFTYLRALVEFQAPSEGSHVLNFEWFIDGSPVGTIEGSVNQNRMGTADLPIYVAVSLPPIQLNIERASTIRLDAFSPLGRATIGYLQARSET